MAKGFCKVCSTEIEVFICCDGFMCGCMGKPTEPEACSEECYNEIINNFEKYYPKNKNLTVKII